MTPEERAARGIRARQLLESEEVQQAFYDIEQEIIGEWRKTGWAWLQRRKWAELRGLERLKARLASFAGRAPR